MNLSRNQNISSDLRNSIHIDSFYYCVQVFEVVDDITGSQVCII